MFDVTVRKVGTEFVAYYKDEVYPMLEDIQINARVVDAVLNLCYKENIIIIKNKKLDALREEGLRLDKAWRETSRNRKNAEIRLKVAAKKRKELKEREKSTQGKQPYHNSPFV